MAATFEKNPLLLLIPPPSVPSARVPPSYGDCIGIRVELERAHCLDGCGANENPLELEISDKHIMAAAATVGSIHGMVKWRSTTDERFYVDSRLPADGAATAHSNHGSNWNPPASTRAERGHSPRHGADEET